MGRIGLLCTIIIFFSISLTTVIEGIDLTPNKTGFHIVKQGETLWRIGKIYGVSPESIMKANSFSTLTVKIGQRLIIPELQEVVSVSKPLLEQEITPLQVPLSCKKIPASSIEGFKIKTIVIDAGHGGKDTGAIGKGGLLEKDVVLDLAKRLELEIKKKLPNVNVFLTRKNDYFIPLRERTSFANRKKADLFICIHANAAYSSEANGFEVYHLSTVASDNHARAIAAAENEVVRFEEKEQSGKRKDHIKFILGDLAQSEFINESVELAGLVQTGVNKRLNIENRGIKGAFFWVLKDAMMPAVLIETAFISNPVEEELLNNEKFKDIITTAICEAIVNYKSLYEKQFSK